MSKATIFAPDADSPDFAPALTLGQGLPKNIDGAPCGYFWKEVLRPRRFLDAAGTEHNVTADRINLLLSSFKKLAGKGKFPTLPSHHPQAGEPKDALANLGHAVDAKVNGNGGLEVLCRFVGVDAIRASARNSASIGTLPDFTDPDGERYAEIIDHIAIVPDPRLTDLDTFKPALAASSGPAVPAVVVSPAAALPDRSEPPMNLKELRTALKLADTATDDAVLAAAVKRVTDDATAFAAEKKRADDAAALAATEKQRADTAALQLAEGKPRQVDTEILNDRMGTFSDKLDVLMERNRCTPEQKKAAMEIVAPGGKPAALMLSQSIATGPAAAVLKLLELQDTNPFGRKTDAQGVPNAVPGATPDGKPITPERVAQLMSGTPLGQSVLAEAARLAK